MCMTHTTVIWIENMTSQKNRGNKVRCFRVKNSEKNAQIEKWKIRHNQELHDIFQRLSITKRKKKEWVGHA